MLKTYIGGMAEVAGSTPATGAYSYYATDNPCRGEALWRSRVGSPRAVYNQAKAVVAELDYTPYGQAYTANDTIGITHRYTGHDWDATAALYFAPYRFYNPQLARWMTRDPLGMVDGPNVYSYVSANPTSARDPFGLMIDLLYGCSQAPDATAASGICDCYDSGESHLTYDAKCVCEKAGDSPWDMTVRGCLACAHGAGTPSWVAHALCYRVAQRRYGRMWRDVLDIAARLTTECAGFGHTPDFDIFDFPIGRI